MVLLGCPRQEISWSCRTMEHYLNRPLTSVEERYCVMADHLERLAVHQDEQGSHSTQPHNRVELQSHCTENG